MDRIAPEKRLYNLLLLGLYWLRQDKPHIKSRTGSGVFRAWHFAKVISLQDRNRLPTNQGLLNTIIENAETARFPKPPRREAYRLSVEQSDKHLFVLIVPDGMFLYPKLIAPEGYKLELTPAGTRYVEGALLDYAQQNDIERGDFLAGWENNRRQMENLHTGSRE